MSKVARFKIPTHKRNGLRHTKPGFIRRGEPAKVLRLEPLRRQKARKELEPAAVFCPTCGQRCYSERAEKNALEMWEILDEIKQMKQQEGGEADDAQDR